MAIPTHNQIIHAINQAPFFEDWSTAQIPGANVIYMDTSDELALTYVRTYEVLGTAPDAAVIARAVGHEKEHAYAAAAVGAVALGFALQFYQANRTKRITCVPVFRHKHHADTFLDAAITLYPLQLSPGDHSEGSRMGYDVDRLAYEASRRNRATGERIPIPLSYKKVGMTTISLGRFRRRR